MKPNLRDRSTITSRDSRRTGPAPIALNRRQAIAAVSGTLLLSAAAAARAADDERRETELRASADYKIAHERILQSVVHWCFNPMPVETLAAAAARMGLKSVELVGPEHWATLKKH